MAAAFNLTAEINLRGPSNLNRVVSDIRRQLSTVSLNLNINPNATRGIQAATGQVQGLSAALQTANANATNLTVTLRNLGAAISGASSGMNTLAGGLNNIGRQTTNIQANVGAATSSMEEFGRQSALAVRRFAAFSVATGGIYALVKAISSGYNEFLTFNKELVRLQQVTGATSNGLKGITDEITRLATGFGVTSSELLTVSSTLAQAGLNATQTKTALEALAKSALAPSFDNLNDTVEGSIALMRQFGISAGDLESSLGSINAVAAAFAVESGDIIKAIQRTGGVFANASKGISEGKDALNEFIALFTSVRATTRESAETIATGLRTIFTRVQRGGTIQALKEYGITLTDLEGKFVGPFEAVKRLSEGLKSLDPRDLRFSQIVEELGGFRQIGKVIPLIQQFATSQQALAVAQRGAGSLAEAAGTAQLSLANKITKVREEFVALIRDIGQSQSFQTFADISLKLASALISVASAAKEVLPALAALAAIRSIPAIGQFVGGFGRGLIRRHEGGPVRAFASGGFVPGSGDRDTVPAMLTPGEFVIRKKAVKSIGLNRLHSMNKFASGGKVPKFADGGYSDEEWMKEMESIRRKYKLPLQSEIDRMSPAEKAAYEDRLGQIAFSSPSPGREKKAIQAMQQKAARKSKLGLFFSAAGLKRGPKASPGMFEQTMLKYQGSVGMTSIKPKFIAWGKGQGSFDDVVKGSEDKIRSQLSGVQLENFNKLLTTKTLSNYLSSGGKMGHIPPLKKAIYQIMGVTGKNVGGFIQKFRNGREVKGLDPKLASRVKEAGGFENLISKNMMGSDGVYNFGLVSLRSGTSKGSRIENRQIGNTGKKARIHIGNLSDKQQYDNIEKNITSSLKSVINSTGKSLASSLGSSSASGVERKKILSGAVLSSATGSIFEAALQMVGAPYIDKIESIKSMDFPFGLGPAASLFGSFPSDVPTDATRTVGGSGKGISDFVGQINRFLGAVDKKSFTKSLSPKIGTYTATDLLGRVSRNPKDRDSINNILSTFGLPNIGPRNKLTAATSNNLNKALSTNRTLLDQLLAAGLLSGKAGGGSISGEDTVPALLTPGEFVINKKAAKKIGSAKLNKLNKADKIQGFNKGGSVGNIQNFAGGGGVQRFFVGGLVQMFTGLTRSVGQLIPIFGNLASTTAATTRNMAAQQVATFRQQGLSGAALKNAMVNAGYGPGGVNNMRTRNQMTQMATQRASTAQAQGQGGGGLGMGLMFVGPMIAEAINSAITSGGGPISKAVGSSITSVISGITVGAAFGPWGMLVGAVAGAGSAILNWTKTLQAAETVEKEKIIENKSQSLEKSFERLAKEVDKVEIGKIQDSIIADIQAILAAQQTVSSNTISAVEPSTLGRMMGYKIDTTALSKDLSQAASVAGVNIQRYIEYGMSRGQNFDELLGKFGDTGRESLAITRAGPELTLLKALAQEARSSGNRQRYGDENLSAVELEDKYRQRIAEINDEFKKAAVEQQAAQKNLNAVVIAVDHFAVAIKKLESVIGRAGAEFEEAQRRMDISFGTMLGEEAKIAAPSRMNENILQNPAAYTAEEISSAIRDLGQNLQFSPDFTKQLETATISKSVIQAGLPKILAEAAAAQKAPGGGGLEGASETAIRDKLEELFRNVPGMNAGDAAEASSKLFESIQNRLESNKDISLSELSTNDPALNKIMEGYNNTVDAAAKAQSEYNQILSQVNSRLNQYVSALERASEAQNQAAIVRTEGQNRLTEALGGELSLQELNKTFEDTLLTLTSRIGGNGLAIRGTGTTDADAISRRLRIESDRLKTLQSQKVPAAGTAAFDKYNRDLANATLSVRNLTKAQEKLATDTTRASNALSKIQSIRQAQESRRGTFDEVLKNLNNPEWMMQFVRQVESLQRVQTGRGNIMDIGPALDALQQRLAGMADAGEREAERTKFYNNIARILERAGMNRADIDNAMRLIGNRGEEPELANAIDQYTQAIQQQAAAIEAGGVLTRTSAQDFYTEIMRAANDFVARVGQAGAQPAAGQVEASKGGLIYASKGQLINYQPKGTDTVPAMLTPGEFVVNKKATQKNLGLLKSINSGSTVVSQNGVAYARTGGQILDGLRGDSYLLQNLDGQSVTGSSASDRKIGERNRKAANDIKDRMLDSMKELNNKILSTAGPDDDTLFKDIFTNTNFFKTTDPTIIRFLPTPQFNDWRSSISEALLRARDLLLSDLIDNKNGSLLAQPTTTSGQPLPQNPNQPSNQNKNIPSPDYYDELTYKEYLDKLVRSRNEPQPPIRSKFTTDAFYTKTGIDRVVGKQTKQDILDKLYNEHGSNYEFFRDNIKNNIWPERAILDSAYRQQLIAAAENFENYLNFEGIPIPAPYENIETLGSSARITAFDSRLTGPINGGPSNLADLDKLKEFGTMFEAYVNGSARDVRDYLLLKNKDNADPEAIKALANNIKTNYEGAINSLKNITELTRIFKNGKNIVPNDSGKDIGLNSLVGQLKNYVKPSYKTSLTEIGQENFNFDDSLLDVFESKYAQMIEQNAQGSADPVRGKDIVSGMTSQERDNIRGRKSARSQYESSLIYYKYARGKYNRQSMLDQRRAAYLDPSVGRPQMLNSGGVVYANNGQLINFQPRGTDTVPAMLTPGEFVVNARAAKNNLGLLQNINNGGKKYSRGGVVYLQEGGFAGLSDSELKILELAKISPESIVEFSQNDALSDKKSFEFFKDLERQLNERNFKTVRTTGEPSSNFDPADFGDGINPTATLISAARESLPTIAATLVGLGTTTMMSSPAAGPGAPAVAGVGAVLAGIGSAIAAYMLTKEAQGVLIEDQIKTSEGTLRDTLNKIAAENPVSTAVGGAIPGIAAGGVPQLGKSAIAQGLTGAGISSTVTVGRKLMENNLQFDTADMVDILSSAVPGSNVANLGDNLYRTIAPAIAALPIIATTRNSSKAASKLRTPAGFLDIAGQSQRAIENWNNTDIISKLRLLGLNPLHLQEDLSLIN
jgi:TP901 family phage tail tape measure protein